jgi:hypothetical protein
LAASRRSWPPLSFLGKPVLKFSEASRIAKAKLIWKPHKILSSAFPESWGEGSFSEKPAAKRTGPRTLYA